MQIKLLGADWIEKCKYLSLVVIEESKKIIFEIKIACTLYYQTFLRNTAWF